MPIVLLSRETSARWSISSLSGFFWLPLKRVIVVPFELHWFKLSTTLGTVRWVTGKLPLRLHFFGHGAEPIEVHTRQAQQHCDLSMLYVVLYVEFFVRKVKQRADVGRRHTR
jgi:hypothetical protein